MADSVPPQSPFYVQAARASVLVPFIAICAGVVLTAGQLDQPKQQEDLTRLTPAIISAVLIPLGLILASWGMIGGLMNGRLGTAFIAVIGFSLNGFIVFAAITSFLHIRQIAEKRSAEQAALASDAWIPEGDGWHIDRQNRFAIQFPEGWEVMDKVQPHVSVAALCPVDRMTANFRANIAVVVDRAAPGDEPLDSMERELDFAKSQAIEVKVHDRGTKSINGVTWHWMEYNQVALGAKAKVTASAAIRYGRLYVVLCSQHLESENSFQQEFDAAIDSIRVP